MTAHLFCSFMFTVSAPSIIQKYIYMYSYNAISYLTGNYFSDSDHNHIVSIINSSGLWALDFQISQPKFFFFSFKKCVVLFDTHLHFISEHETQTAAEEEEGCSTRQNV